MGRRLSRLAMVAGVITFMALPFGAEGLLLAAVESGSLADVDIFSTPNAPTPHSVMATVASGRPKTGDDPAGPGVLEPALLTLLLVGGFVAFYCRRKRTRTTR